MADLRLRKLPERTPVKLTISLAPDLHQMLTEYAELYRASYGTEEPVSELVPYMLRCFVEADRTFMRGRPRS